MHIINTTGLLHLLKHMYLIVLYTAVLPLAGYNTHSLLLGSVLWTSRKSSETLMSTLSTDIHSRVKEEQSETAYLRQGHSAMDPDSVSGLLPKFNGDFLVQGYICDRIVVGRHRSSSSRTTSRSHSK